MFSVNSTAPNALRADDLTEGLLVYYSAHDGLHCGRVQSWRSSHEDDLVEIQEHPRGTRVTMPFSQLKVLSRFALGSQTYLARDEIRRWIRKGDIVPSQHAPGYHLDPVVSTQWATRPWGLSPAISLEGLILEELSRRTSPSVLPPHVPKPSAPKPLPKRSFDPASTAHQPPSLGLVREDINQFLDQQDQKRRNREATEGMPRQLNGQFFGSLEYDSYDDNSGP